MPAKVHLLTLQFLGDNDYLLRLEHQFEVGEGELGTPVKISLSVSDAYRNSQCSLYKELGTELMLELTIWLYTNDCRVSHFAYKVLIIIAW